MQMHFLIDAALQNGVAGIILEGVGRGQVAPKMMPAIKRAIKKKYPGYYYNKC